MNASTGITLQILRARIDDECSPAIYLTSPFRYDKNENVQMNKGMSVSLGLSKTAQTADDFYKSSICRTLSFFY